uniref:Uncharacterized protein n=1 Tax=Sphaerodactylus townsendi TaxID=933632 RepID=A0ACB8EZM8_9SAUR
MGTIKFSCPVPLAGLSDRIFGLPESNSFQQLSAAQLLLVAGVPSLEDIFAPFLQGSPFTLFKSRWTPEKLQQIIGSCPNSSPPEGHSAYGRMPSPTLPEWPVVWLACHCHNTLQHLLPGMSFPALLSTEWEHLEGVMSDWSPPPR